MNVMAKITRQIIYIFSGVVLSVLTFISLISSCFVGLDEAGEERIYYFRDYPLVHIVAFALLMGLLYWVRQKKISREKGKKIVKYILWIWGIAALFWVIIYQKDPVHDSRNVLMAATGMRQYNFTSFTEGNYLYAWSGNRKLALCLYLVSFLIGVDNYVLLRMLNVGAFLLIFWLLYKFVDDSWGKETMVPVIQVLACCLFVPLLLYTTLIYGDGYGLALAVSAVYAQLKYFSKRKYKWACLSALLIAAACIVRMNELIVWIAMIVLAIYDVLLTRKWKEGVLYILILVGAVWGINNASEMTLQRITQMRLSDGVPVESWIAMGLQDNDNGRGPGCYNGYNLWSFNGNDYDTEKTRAEARKDIRETLEEFSREPDEAVRFLLRKIAGQWNNPDGEVFNGTEIKEGDLAAGIKAVYNEKNIVLIRICMNFLQTWILAGALCYLLFHREKTEYGWIFLLIFLGGFLFHLFWEASGRYAVPYYVMLIPYACMGMVSVEERIEEAGRSCLTKRNLLAVTVILLVAAGLPFLTIWRKAGLVTENKPAGQEKMVKSGFCYICTETGDLYLSEQEGSVLVLRQKTEEQKCSLYAGDDGYTVRFQKDQSVLSIEGDDVCATKEEYPLEWSIRMTKDHKCYIMKDEETVLAYNPEDWTVYLTEFEENKEEQLWKVCE